MSAQHTNFEMWMKAIGWYDTILERMATHLGKSTDYVINTPPSVNLFSDNKPAVESLVAAQNLAAAYPHNFSETTVHWCESACAWSVRCNGELIDWFPTRTEAEGYAKHYDHLKQSKTKSSETAPLQ